MSDDPSDDPSGGLSRGMSTLLINAATPPATVADKNEHIEFREVDLNESDQYPQDSRHLAEYPPPPPEPDLHCSGIVVIDITEKFASAARREFPPSIAILATTPF